MIKPEPKLPISEQCQLLQVSRSSTYYQSTGVSPLNQLLMRKIDEYHTDRPTWGSRMIRDKLALEGYVVNRKRIQRLMELMYIKTIYRPGTEPL